VQGVTQLGAQVDPMGNEVTRRDRKVSWRRIPEDIGRALGVGVAEPVCAVVRCHWAVNGETAAISTTYLTNKAASSLGPAAGLSAGDVGDLPLRALRADPDGQRQPAPAMEPAAVNIEVGPPPSSLARGLRLAPGQSAALVTVRYDDPAARRPAALLVAALRTDLFRIVVTAPAASLQPLLCGNMSLLLAGRDDEPSYLRPAGACAALAVLLQLLFAQLTLALAGCLVLIGRLTRWPPGWLLIPAVAGFAWVLAVGPRVAVAGYVTAADLAIRRLTGPRAWDSLPATLARWRDWLPAQLPLGLVAAAAEASVAILTGLTGGARPYRPGALVTIRRAYLIGSIRRGELATADGGRIGLIPATGRPAAIGWREAERGVLCTGREREGVTATGLDLTLAAIQHCKTVIIVDLAGGAAAAIGSACVAARAPLRCPDARGRGYEPFLRAALAGRQVLMFPPGRAAPAVARLVVAELAATLRERSEIGVPEDCLVWINGCDAVEPAGLRELLAAAGCCRGTAIVLGTASGRIAAGLAGQVNVIVLAGQPPDGFANSPQPTELLAAGRDGQRSLLVREPRRLVRCVTVR